MNRIKKRIDGGMDYWNSEDLHCFNTPVQFILMQDYGMKKVCSMDKHFQIVCFDVYAK